MLIEGLRLMVVGMTTVFAFLAILVVAMNATRMVAQSIGGDAASSPREADGSRDPSRDPSGARQLSVDREIAVVLAAIRAARGGR